MWDPPVKILKTILETFIQHVGNSQEFLLLADLNSFRLEIKNYFKLIILETNEIPIRDYIRCDRKTLSSGLIEPYAMKIWKVVFQL